MSVNYIFDEDLLAHLKFADSAVNLTTTLSPWSQGLSKAYAEKFPEIYKQYRKEQEEYKISVGEIWEAQDKTSKKSLLCLPVKYLAGDFGDKDVVENTLKALSEHVGEKAIDIIMPITIIGSLEESIAFMRKSITSKAHTHYWIGISTKRAKEAEFKRDKMKVFLTGTKDLPRDKIEIRLLEVLKQRELSADNVQVVSIDTNNDLWPKFKGEQILYKPTKSAIPRIAHFSDFGVAFLKRGSVNLKYNEFVQKLREKGLDITFAEI